MLESDQRGTRRIIAGWEQRVRFALELGLGPLGWVLCLGAAFGVGVVFLAPRLPLAVHPKYGSGAFVVLSALLALGGCFGLAKLRSPVPFAEAFKHVSLGFRRYASGLLLLIFAITASRGLERQSAFIVLALALACAWTVGQWFWVWMSRINPGARLLPERVSLSLLGGLVLAYTGIMSVLSINNHLAFNTGRADLGFYVSIFRRSSLGDPLGCTICGGGNHLSGHFDPILVLLSPLYLIHPEAETVLALQSLLLGSTMIPLYLLARHNGLGAVSALALCLGFGLHPALHGINLFDFHSLALVVPAAVWLLWARDTGSRRAYWVLLGVFLLIREDAALIAVIIGADTLLSHRRFGVWQGLLTVLVGAGYFIAVKTLIMSGSGDPLNPGTGRGYAYYYQDLVPKGTGTLGLVNTVLSNPAKVLPFLLEEAKVLYWLQLLIPVLALPLIAQRGRLLLFYGIAFTLLASRKHVYSVHFHYSSVILPFVYYLTIVALARPKRLSRHVGRFLGIRPLPREAIALALAGTLAATALVSWRFGGILPNRSFHAGFRPLERRPAASDLKRDQMLKEVCRTLPKGSSVAASEPHLPHLGRCSAYYVKAKRHLADYLLWSFPKGSITADVRAEMKKGYWEEVRSYGGFKLLKNRFPKGYVAPKSRKARARAEQSRRREQGAPARASSPARATAARTAVPPVGSKQDAGSAGDAGAQ